MQTIHNFPFCPSSALGVNLIEIDADTVAAQVPAATDTDP
jgi:hypothetical protein